MNTANYEDVLRVAAEGDNINLLYTVIQQDPFVLERIDSKPFVETPMHVAAYVGNPRFAIEVMRLKPSYAYKLNQQGFSPIHLAMQRFQELTNQQGADPDQLAIQKRKMMRMVCRLMETDKDIIRVKGREGITPLHFASQNGQVDLLAAFLFACPDSIEDVTIRGQTALHIAARNNQYDALQVLVGLLKKRTQKLASELETKILNWKDDEGNTVLHISVQKNNSRALQLLVKTKISLKLKNLNDFTALDMVDMTNAVMKNILSNAGAKRNSQVNDAPTLAQILRSNVTFMNKIFIFISRHRRAISEEQRNTFMIVATLVATAIYQSSLSPPGGFYQDNDNMSMNTTASQTKIGKSVLPGGDFLLLSIINTLSLLFSTIAIYLLAPISGLEGILLFVPMFYFVCGYAFNMKFISPTSTAAAFSLFMLFGFQFLFFFWGIYVGYRRFTDNGYRLKFRL